jgi:hypothetical protein
MAMTPEKKVKDRSGKTVEVASEILYIISFLQQVVTGVVACPI